MQALLAALRELELDKLLPDGQSVHAKATDSFDTLVDYLAQLCLAFSLQLIEVLAGERRVHMLQATQEVDKINPQLHVAAVLGQFQHSLVGSNSLLNVNRPLRLNRVLLEPQETLDMETSSLGEIFDKVSD